MTTGSQLHRVSQYRIMSSFHLSYYPIKFNNHGNIKHFVRGSLMCDQVSANKSRCHCLSNFVLRDLHLVNTWYNTFRLVREGTLLFIYLFF